MNGSGHLAEDFRQSIFLCPVDLKKLLFIFSFDLVERYQKIKHFFESINASKEVKWLLKSIEDLKP